VCTNSRCRSRTSGPKRSEEAPGRKKPGIFEVSSFSYLPATVTTLFFLAASLLLGYMQ